MIESKIYCLGNKCRLYCWGFLGQLYIEINYWIIFNINLKAVEFFFFFLFIMKNI